MNMVNSRSKMFCAVTLVVAVIAAGPVGAASAEKTSRQIKALGPFEKLDVQPAEVQLQDRYDRRIGCRSDRPFEIHCRDARCCLGLRQPHQRPWKWSDQPEN